MKILIDIPDKYKNRNLYIFAGIEPVARKMYGKLWEVKISECSNCGKCCRTLRDNFPFKVKAGICEYIERRPGKDERYLCSLGAKRPFWCAIGANENSECSVKFKEVK